MFNDKIPTNIYISESTHQFDINGAIIGAAIGGILTGGWGALLGASLAGKSQKYAFTVEFDDESKTHFTYSDRASFLAQSLIWNWRINNKLLEDDFVTFGFRFSDFKKGKIKITGALIAHQSELEKIHNLTNEEKQEAIKKLSDFLVTEITRYLSKHPSIKMTASNIQNGDITFTTELETYIILGICAAFIMFAFHACSQSGKESKKYSFNPISSHQQQLIYGKQTGSSALES